MFRADYEVLAAARRILNAGEAALSEAIHDAEDVYAAARITRVAVAMEAAEDAVFTALNVAGSFLDDEDAYEAIGCARPSA